MVKGRSSSVMRSKRDDVWCILLSRGSTLTGGGVLGSVSEYGWEGGAAARARALPSTADMDERDWLDGLLKGGLFPTGLDGSREGAVDVVAVVVATAAAAAVVLGARERRARDWRGLTTGSEKLTMRFCVLSKAAAAREKMPLETRWGCRGCCEAVEGFAACLCEYE